MDFKEALNSDFSKKANVVYLLSIVRKLLESKLENKENVHLRFFINWALHIKINDLKDFKDFFRDIDTEFHRSPFNRRSINKKISDFISFNILREQLLRFLKDNKLSDIPLTDSVKWGNFLDNFREIILDCPIIIEDIPKSIPGSKIRAFHLTRNPVLGMKDFEVVAWQIWIKTSPYPFIGYIEETVKYVGKIT